MRYKNHLMASTKNVKIEASWKEALAKEFEQPYFDLIKKRLVYDKEAGKTVYPPGSLIFNAFNKVPLPEVKVVIIGQDPYHGPKQAMGLSFSVPKGLRIPASLRNIFKELQNDIEGFEMPNHGDLSSWATQGVLLLNASLTVEHRAAGSHAKIGWQRFTDAVIKTISNEREGVVFLLWGNFAKKKAALINEEKHHILTAVHPSPLAGNRFLGNKHFSQTNEILKAQGREPINWQI